MAEPLSLLNLNHVARRTRDLAASRRFYMEVLGCQEISRPAFSFNGSWLFVAGMQFHLIEDAALPPSSERIDVRQNHIAFAVADMNQMESRLRLHGIPYRRNTITDRAIRQIFFQDPDGWMIEISSDYWQIDR